MGKGVLDDRLRLRDLLKTEIDYERPRGGGAALFDLLGDLRRRRVLDLGCGLAPYRQTLEERGALWVGLDLAGAGPSVHGDAYRLPFRDAAFDGVLSAAVLEHLPDIPSVMDETRRVLKPGGLLFGYVAFLEPLHGMSYFHCSHLGLEVVLGRHGFEPLRIYPSHVAPGLHLEQLLFGKPLPVVQPFVRGLLRMTCAGLLAGNRALRDLLTLARRLPAAQRAEERRLYRQVLALRYAVGFNFIAEKRAGTAAEVRGYRAMVKSG